MKWFKDLLGIVPQGIGILSDHFEEKRARKRLLAESERRVIEARANHVIRKAETNQDADISWESKQVDNSGWKDEYVLIVVSIPVIMGFIPGLADYAQAGITMFESMPVWYQNLVLIVFTAAYGVRIVGRGADVLKKSLTR